MNAIIENQQEIITQLQNSIVAIDFTKKNGEVRKINATLNQEYVDSLKAEKAVNGNVISVFDVDSKTWKSFDLTRVNSYSKV
jgi:hypothetical protein